MTLPTTVRWTTEPNSPHPHLSIETDDWCLEFNLGGVSTMECGTVAPFWHKDGEAAADLPYWDLNEGAKIFLPQLAKEVATPHLPTWEAALQQAEPPLQFKRHEDGYR